MTMLVVGNNIKRELSSMASKRDSKSCIAPDPSPSRHPETRPVRHRPSKDRIQDCSIPSKLRTLCRAAFGKDDLYSKFSFLFAHLGPDITQSQGSFIRVRRSETGRSFYMDDSYRGKLAYQLRKLDRILDEVRILRCPELPKYQVCDADSWEILKRSPSVGKLILTNAVLSCRIGEALKSLLEWTDGYLDEPRLRSQFLNGQYSILDRWTRSSSRQWTYEGQDSRRNRQHHKATASQSTKVNGSLTPSNKSSQPSLSSLQAPSISSPHPNQPKDLTSPLMHPSVAHLQEGLKARNCIKSHTPTLVTMSESKRDSEWQTHPTAGTRRKVHSSLAASQAFIVKHSGHDPTRTSLPPNSTSVHLAAQEPKQYERCLEPKSRYNRDNSRSEDIPIAGGHLKLSILNQMPVAKPNRFSREHILSDMETEEISRPLPSLPMQLATKRAQFDAISPLSVQECRVFAGSAKRHEKPTAKALQSWPSTVSKVLKPSVTRNCTERQNLETQSLAALNESSVTYSESKLDQVSSISSYVLSTALSPSSLTSHHRTSPFTCQTGSQSCRFSATTLQFAMSSWSILFDPGGTDPHYPHHSALRHSSQTGLFVRVHGEIQEGPLLFGMYRRTSAEPKLVKRLSLLDHSISSVTLGRVPLQMPSDCQPVAQDPAYDLQAFARLHRVLQHQLFFPLQQAQHASPPLPPELILLSQRSRSPAVIKIHHAEYLIYVYKIPHPPAQTLLIQLQQSNHLSGQSWKDLFSRFLLEFKSKDPRGAIGGTHVCRHDWNDSRRFQTCIAVVQQGTSTCTSFGQEITWKSDSAPVSRMDRANKLLYNNTYALLYSPFTLAPRYYTEAEHCHKAMEDAVEARPPWSGLGGRLNKESGGKPKKQVGYNYVLVEQVLASQIAFALASEMRVTDRMARHEQVKHIADTSVIATLLFMGRAGAAGTSATCQAEHSSLVLYVFSAERE